MRRCGECKPGCGGCGGLCESPHVEEIQMKHITGTISIEDDVYNALIEQNIILGKEQYRLSEFISNTLALQVHRVLPEMGIDSGSINFQEDKP